MSDFKIYMNNYIETDKILDNMGANGFNVKICLEFFKNKYYLVTITYC